MENNVFSFLFFCFCIPFFLCPWSVHAQSEKDSAVYHYQLILNPKNNDDLAKAINFYTLKKESDYLAKDTLMLLHDLRMIAIGEYKTGNLYDSEEASVEALHLIDLSTKFDISGESRIAILNQLGKIYRSEKNYDKAIEAYNNALTLLPKHQDSITLINNKGNIYKEMKQYENALEQFQILYKSDIPDSLQYARVLDNLGFVKAKLDKPEALSDLTGALNIRERRNVADETYSSYKNLAYYYFDRQNEEKALLFANKAYNTAHAINSITYIKDALSIFAIMNKDPKVLEFKAITDSIANEKQLAENKNAFIKYNVANEKKKTAEALLEREKEKNQKLMFVFLVILILLTSIYLYFKERIKHKKEKITQVQNTESRIAKKVHDEVANDVYHVMTKIQGKDSSNEILLDDLEKIYNKTRDISKENSLIEIKEDFSEQLTDLLLSYQNEKVKIATVNISKVVWSTISELKKITLYRVLQELMTNMRKHSKATAVVVSFQQDKKKLSVSYRDNGNGCDLKNKNGLHNAENRITTLNGTIIFDSKPNDGFKAKISL